MFNQYTPPAYCVTEMSSARDILHKHNPQSRYIYRSPAEQILSYQIAGTDPLIMAQAAIRLEHYGADLIDINCGCPKTKIRKKGAGSALLEEPQKLIAIVQRISESITIPLTVKIRIQGNDADINLAQQMEQAGAHALIIHGRRWVDDYDVPCDFTQIARIKKNLRIPIIANGDINSISSLNQAMQISGCDGFMIARAGSGRPWLYQELLEQRHISISNEEKKALFIEHLEGLSLLENEYKAILQSKSLIRYYFKAQCTEQQLRQFYSLKSLVEIKVFLDREIH